MLVGVGILAIGWTIVLVPSDSSLAAGGSGSGAGSGSGIPGWGVSVSESEVVVSKGGKTSDWAAL